MCLTTALCTASPVNGDDSSPLVSRSLLRTESRVFVFRALTTGMVAGSLQAEYTRRNAVNLGGRVYGARIGRVSPCCVCVCVSS